MQENREIDAHYVSIFFRKKSLDKVGESKTPALTRDGKYRRHDGEARA